MCQYSTHVDEKVTADLPWLSGLSVGCFSGSYGFFGVGWFGGGGFFFFSVCVCFVSSGEGRYTFAIKCFCYPHTLNFFASLFPIIFSSLSSLLISKIS